VLLLLLSTKFHLPLEPPTRQPAKGVKRSYNFLPPPSSIAVTERNKRQEVRIRDGENMGLSLGKDHRGGKAIHARKDWWLWCQCICSRCIKSRKTRREAMTS